MKEGWKLINDKKGFLFLTGRKEQNEQLVIVLHNTKNVTKTFYLQTGNKKLTKKLL